MHITGPLCFFWYVALLIQTSHNSNKMPGSPQAWINENLLYNDSRKKAAISALWVECFNMYVVKEAVQITAAIFIWKRCAEAALALHQIVLDI